MQLLYQELQNPRELVWSKTEAVNCSNSLRSWGICLVVFINAEPHFLVKVRVESLFHSTFSKRLLTRLIYAGNLLGGSGAVANTFKAGSWFLLS